MCHRGSHWKGFSSNLIRGTSKKKIFRRTPRFGHSTWRSQCPSYCWLGSGGKALLYFDSKTFSIYYIIDNNRKKKQFFLSYDNNIYANGHIVMLHINYLTCFNPPTEKISLEKGHHSFALRGGNLSSGACFIKCYWREKRKFWRKRNFVEIKGKLSNLP